MKKVQILWFPMLLSLLLVAGCSSTPTSEGGGAEVSEQSTGADGTDAASTSAASEGGEW
jgi:hypothetical protein